MCKFLQRRHYERLLFYCSDEITVEGWKSHNETPGISTPVSTSLQRGETAGSGLNNGLCLCEEASIKSPKCGVWRAPRLANTSTDQEAAAPQAHRDAKVLGLGTTTHLALCLFKCCLSVSFIMPFQKLVNASPCVQRALSQRTESKEEVRGISRVVAD